MLRTLPRVNTLDCDKVIMTETGRNTVTIVASNLAFEGVSKSNTKYLMAENRKMLNKLQAARQEVEQLQEEFQKEIFAQACLEELKASILGEVSTCRAFMRSLSPCINWISACMTCNKSAIIFLKTSRFFTQPLLSCMSGQCNTKGHRPNWELNKTTGRAGEIKSSDDHLE